MSPLITFDEPILPFLRKFTELIENFLRKAIAKAKSDGLSFVTYVEVRKIASVIVTAVLIHCGMLHNAFDFAGRMPALHVPLLSVSGV